MTLDGYGGELWEHMWQEADTEELAERLRPYERMACRELEVFWANGVHTVCDAGCGFGAYTLALASNGFSVSAFDVSETAVQTARTLLARFGYGTLPLKSASVLDTGYADGAFDGVTAWSVLDHMTTADADAALRELRRITKQSGLILLALDAPEADDLAQEHRLLDDGSILYTAGARAGMVLHPYDERGLESLLRGQNILYRGQGQKGENVVILRK